MIILHGENTTAEPVWHPNSSVRGTWNIYQSCIITIFLCVWMTIHLNIPAPGQKPSQQLWSRIRWSLITIIAPEWVALNAWTQYRDARALMQKVNQLRLSAVPERRSRRLVNSTAFACFAPCRILDWPIVRRCNIRRSFAIAKELDVARTAEENARIDNTRLVWSMSMAFYVLSGGCVHRSRHLERSVVQPDAILWLAENEPEALLPLQRAVLQNPSKANGVAKTVTCVQALWFCVQCIARLKEDLAVSLLELNTFAHCVSTLLIYIFWWDKPYEVESHVLLEGHALDLKRLLAFHNIEKLELVIRTPESHNAQPFSHGIPHSGICSIIDHSGNYLFDQPYKHTNWNYDTLSPHVLRFSMDPRSGMANIPGTGFYIASLPVQNVHSLVFYIESWQLGRWQAFWRSWVDWGLPKLARPIKRELDFGFWFDDRNHNFNKRLVDLLSIEESGILVSLMMTFTFAIYGGLHLIAWRYQFGTKAENLLWKFASTATACSGLLLLHMNLGLILMKKGMTADLENRRRSRRYLGRICWVLGVGLFFSTMPFSLVVNVVARSFLIIESFKALPYSPPSTYTLPDWTTYIPHI